MGKALIIKGADFSANAIGRVDFSENLWTDLQNGFWSLVTPNATCNGVDTWRNVAVAVNPAVESERRSYVMKVPVANARLLINWLDGGKRLLGYDKLTADYNGVVTIDAFEPFAQTWGSFKNAGNSNVKYFAIAIPTPGNDTTNALTAMTLEQIAQCTLKETARSGE